MQLSVRAQLGVQSLAETGLARASLKGLFCLFSVKYSMTVNLCHVRHGLGDYCGSC